MNLGIAQGWCLIVKKEMSVSYGQSVSGMWLLGNTYDKSASMMITNSPVALSRPCT